MQFPLHPSFFFPREWFVLEIWLDMPFNGAKMNHYIRCAVRAIIVSFDGGDIRTAAGKCEGAKSTCLRNAGVYEWMLQFHSETFYLGSFVDGTGRAVAEGVATLLAVWLCLSLSLRWLNVGGYVKLVPLQITRSSGWGLPSKMGSPVDRHKFSLSSSQVVMLISGCKILIVNVPSVITFLILP